MSAHHDYACGPHLGFLKKFPSLKNIARNANKVILAPLDQPTAGLVGQTGVRGLYTIARDLRERWEQRDTIHVHTVKMSYILTSTRASSHRHNKARTLNKVLV